MLEVLLKGKELRDAKAELEKAQAEAKALETREAELAQDIEAATTDEEKAVVEDAVTEFRTAQQENREKSETLEKRVAEIEAEIAELEKNQEPPEPEKEPEPEKREDKEIMRTKKFYGMDASETREFFQREDVKAFNAEIRSAIKEHRSITGAEITVPEVYLGLIRENIEEFSKLYKHANVRQVSGNGVEAVMGTIPEAVWTQCCANINQLALSFAAVEVGCWKVGGYFALCKATAEDSDENLAGEIITALGGAIGLALDKAIVFGLGTRMPLGFFTRLAQTSQPADYPANARPWVDLHTSNVKTISTSDSTGVKLFQNIITNAAAAKGKYSRGEFVWIMNETTYTTLKAESMSINAAGAVVAGVEGTMPVAGGAVEVLDFIPDNMIFAGYMDLYLLAERAGVDIAESREVKFLEDEYVFKGTARYDGKPSIAEGFVAIGIKNTTPSAASITFAADSANPEQSAS